MQDDDIDELEQLVIGRAADGRVVQLKDVGYLQVGYDVRRGIADVDGEGEVVGGIVIMEQGENVLGVSRYAHGASSRSYARRCQPASRS